MIKAIRTIRGKRYRLTPMDAVLVDSLRMLHRMKLELDKLKSEFEQKSKGLIDIARQQRGDSKSMTFDGIDVKIRVEFPETQSWNKSKLEEIAKEYGAVFFEFFQSSVSYTPLPKLNLLLSAKVSQGNEALAADIRDAKIIKQGKPKLRFLETR